MRRSGVMQTTALLLPLLLLVTPAIARATNERSYKWGFSVGFSDYNHCFDINALDCSPPNNDAPLEVCVSNPVNHEVTNSTACIDGYIQGWQHWCKLDLKDCGQFTMEGHLPGALISGHNLYHTADGNYIKLRGILPIPPRPSTVPDVSKGVCPPGKFLDKTFGIYSCTPIGKTRELHPNVKLVNCYLKI
jgi:hypothetical protein